MIIKKKKAKKCSQQSINNSEQEESEGWGWQPVFYSDSKEHAAPGMWLLASFAQLDKYRSTICVF